MEAFDGVYILMNNAGVDASGTHVADVDIDDFHHAIRSNLYGPLICCKHFINHRQQAGGGGRILNVTSVHQEQPWAGAAGYDCSKGALRNLTRTLVLEVSELGITVNNIAPGMVLTPFNQKAIHDPDFLEQQVQSIPLKRAAEPAEIARLAVFLASEEASYVTDSPLELSAPSQTDLRPAWFRWQRQEPATGRRFRQWPTTSRDLASRGSRHR